MSELGKVLDPTADRLLFIVGVGGIIIDGAAPLWFSLLVLVREVLVGGDARRAHRCSGMKRFDVTWLGKAGTFALMFAFPAFLLGRRRLAVAELLPRGRPGCFGIPGLVLSYYAAITYVPIMRAQPAPRAGGRAEGGRR